jgi:XTP/dITP diphosphohydrolase
MTQVLFATSNPHKIEEVAAVLAPLGLEVIGLDDLPDARDIEEPVEDGATFADNARIKAVAYAAATGRPCLADDSGLEVDSLDGAPGVHSARYSGAGGTRAEPDRRNNEKLLAALQGVDTDRRTARFVCVLCLAGPDGDVLAETPAGDNGFGYDPLLYLPDDRCTSAELTPEEKNARSHRGHAARALATLISESDVLRRCYR